MINSSATRGFGSDGGLSPEERIARQTIRLSDVDAESLARLASFFGLRSSGPMDETEEARESRRAREKVEDDKRLPVFKEAVLARVYDAYVKGRDELQARNTQAELDYRAQMRAYNIRSIVLVLVVLAVVSMPIIAITTKLAPSDFGTFVAPITGIAGTIVGYWFGSGERPQAK